MALPSMPKLSLIGAVAVVGAIAGLAAAHVSVPAILDYAEAALIAGAFGMTVPTPPPSSP